MKAQMERSSYSDLFQFQASASCAKDESSSVPGTCPAEHSKGFSAKRYFLSHFEIERDEWQLRHASQPEDMPARPPVQLVKMMFLWDIGNGAWGPAIGAVVGVRSWGHLRGSQSDVFGICDSAALKVHRFRQARWGWGLALGHSHGNTKR
jgi:hypothetical protein